MGDVSRVLPDRAARRVRLRRPDHAPRAAAPGHAARPAARRVARLPAHPGLDRLEAKDFAGTLLRHVDNVVAAPRREHPPVAFDFWDQVNQAEEYDEIKQYRPSAFLALPMDPG